MPINKKLNLARFKRSMAGLMEFVLLVEQADPALREKIIEQALSEDADFMHKVMRKVVYFDEIIYLDDGIIAEILSSASAKVVAYALHGTKPEFRDKILKLVGFREMRLIKDEEEKMGSTVTSGLILGARKQILKIARGLEQKNKFVFELHDCPRFHNKLGKQVA